MPERKKVKLKDKEFVIYIDQERIANRVSELGEQISRDCLGIEIHIIIVLKGAMMFASDLLKRINVPCTIETMQASSYGDAMHSSGEVHLAQIPNVTSKHVILVEDIVDTAQTMSSIVDLLHKQNPASVVVASLLSKPEMHKVKIPLRYVGFEIPPDFVVGYGMDYAEYGRNLPDIYVLDQQ